MFIKRILQMAAKQQSWKHYGKEKEWQMDTNICVTQE